MYDHCRFSHFLMVQKTIATIKTAALPLCDHRTTHINHKGKKMKKIAVFAICMSLFGGVATTAFADEVDVAQAVTAYDGEDYKAAAAGFHSSESDATAQYYLGMMAENGQGGEKKDAAAALAWYKKSAAQGNTDAAAAVERLSAKK